MSNDQSRTNIRSAAPWEPLVGYSRAVRVGNFVGEGDAYAQAVRCIEVISAALQAAGADIRHVVRTRTFVFEASPPATSMVEVSKLINPRMLIEIEADAIVDNNSR